MRKVQWARLPGCDGGKAMTAALHAYNPTRDFSADQILALRVIEKWRGSGRPHFVLGGFAVTGKSTLVSQLANEWNGGTVVAYCGKATHDLRS